MARMARRIAWIQQHRRGVGLTSLALLALALRLAVLLLAGVTSEGNAFEHGEIAQNLLNGRGFTVRYLGVEGPTSQQAPLYPFLLAGASLVCGGFGASALLLVELLQCAAGAAIVLAVAGIGWALFPAERAVGWLAGIAAAVFPSHIYMATQIQVVTWATLLLTLLVLLAVRGPGRRPLISALSLGLLAGLLLLVEPILAVTLPIISLAAWSRERALQGLRWRAWRPGMHAGVVAAVACLAIAPWLVRNYRAHGEFVFIKSSFGYAFWQGNNEASWGTDKVPKPEAEQLRTAHDGTLAGVNRALWEARHETIYIDDLLLQPAGYREFQGLTEPQRSRLLGKRAQAAIAADPMRYMGLCGQRLRYFLLFDETNPKAANRLYRAATITWLLLCLLGLLTTTSRWRALWPTYAIFGGVMLFHALTITSARFRMPLEPMTFVWIAAGVAPLFMRLNAAAAELGFASVAALRRIRSSDKTSAAPRRSPPAPHVRLPIARSSRRSRIVSNTRPHISRR